MNPTRKRILIAHCHEDILIMLEKRLEDADFDTTTVWTAKEALRLMGLRAFDLLLVNEYLPDAECEELLNALQRTGKNIPFIVMQQGAPEIVDLARFRRLGAKEIVCRYRFHQISEIVRQCLSCDERQATAA